ncbi:hypothetical protein PTW37_15375 [Arthrobacter agilis]|uniref:hypothetical protein n=1 Tax=Arthrobacter agilis TaxID=37921 RepID=UPI0023650762|nr:hypothetical protein [Arthrobacter agilis]WDF33208.1 hypothetical protein PTW37_15375 [Arthrobacter agilis]
MGFSVTSTVEKQDHSGVVRESVTVDRQYPFENHRECILRVLRDQGMEPFDLWVYYYGVGGSLGDFDIEAYLFGLMPLPELEHLLLIEATGEILSDNPQTP